MSYRAATTGGALLSLSGISAFWRSSMSTVASGSTSSFCGSNPHAIVTDVGSVKSGPLATVAEHADVARYCGSHPMAGTQHSGPLTASATLFEGRPWAVTPHGSTSALATQVARYRDAICRYFPSGARISEPQGGFVLWVELPAPPGSDVILQRKALERRIAIAPGSIFSARERFSNAIRINCGAPLDERIDRALKTLGQLAGEL